MDIRQLEDVEKTAAFLYHLNNQKEHHAGYIKQDLDHIKAQLEQLNKEDMLIVEEDGEIISAVGVEQANEPDVVYVLGPITLKTDEATLECIREMFTKIKDTHPHVKTYKFYVHEDHRFAQRVMKALRTQYLGTRYTMETTHDTEETPHQVIKYSKVYKKGFDTLMKNLYAEPKNIKTRILMSLEGDNPTHELFLHVNEGIVKGYVWVQVNNNRTCYIEYVATHTEYRHRGIGHQLVLYAVNHVFRKHHATAMQLSVESRLEKTIEFYEKIGFKKINEMNHFKYDVED